MIRLWNSTTEIPATSACFIEGNSAKRAARNNDDVMQRTIARIMYCMPCCVVVPTSYLLSIRLTLTRGFFWCVYLVFYRFVVFFYLFGPHLLRILSATGWAAVPNDSEQMVMVSFVCDASCELSGSLSPCFTTGVNMGACGSAPKAPAKPENTFRFQVIPDKFESIEEVQDALRGAGLESSEIIVAVDFTKSNEQTGAQSFGGTLLSTDMMGSFRAEASWGTGCTFALTCDFMSSPVAPDYPREIAFMQQHEFVQIHAFYSCLEYQTNHVWTA